MIRQSAERHAAAVLLAAFAGVSTLLYARAEDATAPAATPAPPVVDIASLLPRDLSPWSMFMNTDIVVKTVIVGLAFASLVTWTLWIAKGLEVEPLNRELLRMKRTLK